jgi:hypothetical protein
MGPTGFPELPETFNEDANLPVRPPGVMIAYLIEDEIELVLDVHMIRAWND